jgi:HEAT repeat protein
VTAVVLLGLGAAVLYLAWRTGEMRRPPAGGRRVPAALVLALLAVGIPRPAAEACGQAPAALASTVRYWGEQLGDPSPANRAVAVAALGETRSSAAVPLLAGALDDADEGIRLAALRALARVGSGAAPALGAIQRRLADPSADVRAQALRTLDAVTRPPPTPAPRSSP